ncbi:MAG TPA: 3'-5' exonuclease, partial [Candidatus Wallbacteria bacterium]|nr:3'-5' exonuclease [Candidatus Wallbacteria bacterium]
MIKNNVTRREKTLWTQGESGEKITVYEAINEQAEVVFAINQMRQVIYREDKKYSDFAFFYRTNAQSRVIEETLIKEGIPYKMVGAIRFYQRKEIKDVIAYLRLILNTSDNLSLLRILNVPRRGIGEKSISSLVAFANEKKISIFDALAKVAEIEDLPLKAKNTTLNFVDLINELRADCAKLNVTELTKNVLDKTGYLRELKVINSSQTLDRSKNINELLSVTEAYDQEKSGGGLSGFLERVTLISDLDEIDEKQNSVTLMTFHAAKGLEFPVVFMLGMEEKLFPHEHSSDENYDIAEERRLCYVGMTRARERLYIIHTRQRRIFGSVFTNPVSRFVSEIPDSLVINISCEEEFLNSVPQMTRKVFRDSAPRRIDDDDDGYGSRDLSTGAVHKPHSAAPEDE